MGQYYDIVNLTTKQKLKIEGGHKLMEFGYDLSDVMLKLRLLLSTEWSGNAIALIGDYAETIEEPQTMGEEGCNKALALLMGKCKTREAAEKRLKEISMQLNADDLNYINLQSQLKKEDNGYSSVFGRFVYNLDKKEYIDTARQLVDGAVYDPSEDSEAAVLSIYFVRIDTLAVLLAAGNGQGCGDYFYQNKDMAGYWAGDRLTCNKPDDASEYKLIEPIFYEGDEFDDYCEYSELFDEDISKLCLKRIDELMKRFVNIDWSSVQFKIEALDDTQVLWYPLVARFANGKNSVTQEELDEIIKKQLPK